MVKRKFRAGIYVSLYLNCMIVMLVFFGSLWMMTDRIPSSSTTLSSIGVRGLRYFTVDSNLLAGLVSLLLIARDVLILLGRGRRPPVWLSALNLASVSSLAVTFLMVLGVLAPRSANGFLSLYREANLLFHAVVPLLAFADFFFLSSNRALRRPWFAAGALPLFLYGVYYCAAVLKNAAADGTIPAGSDWYHLFGGRVSRMPLMLLLMLAAGLGISALLCLAMNRRGRRLRERHRAGHADSDFHSISDSLDLSAATASEFYITKVMRLICLVAPATGLCAAVIFTSLWLTGSFQFSFPGIFIFDSFCLFYPVAALYLFNTGIDPQGIAVPSKVKLGKLTLTAMLLLQWNLISYIAPFREFWAYSFLFVLLSAMFLDRKLVLTNIVGILLSIAVSAVIRGDRLLPPPGDSFASSVVFRVVLLVLGFTLIWLMIWLIENILLKTLDTLSDYDALTHAMNRRKLRMKIEEAIGDFNMKGEAFCIAIYDLDDFKKVNDTYGHVNGDEVLIESVRIMNSAANAEDTVFRYGGEEFLILFRCGEQHAAEACRRFARNLSAKHFRFMQEGEHITATVGLVRYEAGMSVQSLIEKADGRLYAGKHQGKNQIVV